MKKVFSLLLALFLAFVLLPMNAEAATVAEGTCGDNLTWTLEDEGTLTISGEGEMTSAPWEHYSSQIKTVIIEEGVTTIYEAAFSSLENMTSVTIPEGVTSIGYAAFNACKGLTEVTLPSTLTIIGNNAFTECTNLTSVTIPEGVTSIGDWAFSWTGLTSVTIPEGVTVIGMGAFNTCEALTEVSLPGTLTDIGAYAFQYSALTSVTIPESVTSIGNSAFDGCENLTSATLPSTLTVIENYLFNDTKLTSVTIPEGVTSIGDWAFSGTALTSVTIPEGVTAIGMGAFGYCERLTDVTLLGTLTVIGEHSFCDTALTSVTIPESVTSIGNNAFNSCGSLTAITFAGDAPAFAENTFGGVVADAYYPADNANWTNDVLQDYGGTIRWVPYYAFSSLKPTVSVVKNTYNSLLVTWTRVEGAEYYEVYRSTSPDSGFIELDTYDSETFSKVSIKLATGTEYYYKVRAYRMVDGKKEYSAYSDVVSETPVLSAPSLVVANDNYTTLKVTCIPVDGAYCYELYRSTSPDSGFVHLMTHRANSMFTFNSSKLAPHTTYYYKARAYRVINGFRIYSAYSDVVSGTPTLSAPTVTVTNDSYNSLKVSWKKVDGASFYQVYRSVKGANDWKLLGVYDENTFSKTSTSLGTGITYEYRVRCYRWSGGERRFSEYSDVKSGTPILSHPTGVKAVTGNTTGTVNVSWNKVDGAEYYQVYRSVKGYGDWKLLGVYDADTLSMTSKALGSGQTYYYRVRCYRWAGGERQFSTWSTIVNAVAK